MRKKIDTGRIGIVKTKVDYRKYFIVIVVLYLVISYLFMHLFSLMETEDGINIFTAFDMLWQKIASGPFTFAVTGATMKALGGLTFIYFLFALYVRREVALRHHDADGIEKGSASWNMDYDRCAKEYAEEDFSKNMILSKNVMLAVDHKLHGLNNNQIIFGGSGTGKTFKLIKPNILQANCSFVITDPKGEILEDTGSFLMKQGYKVKVLNLIDMEHSHQYNPLKYIKKEEDVLALVRCIISNTQDPNAKEDFFDKATEALLQAIIFLLWMRYPGQANLNKVMELIALAEVDEENPNAKSPLDQLFEQEHRDHPDSIAYKQYTVYHKGSPKTIESINISAGVRLASFNIKAIKNLTAEDTLELEKMGDERTALFLIVPTGSSPFNFIAAMMYTQLFKLLYEKASNICPNRYNWFATRKAVRYHRNKNGKLKPSVEKAHDIVLSVHDSEKEADEWKEKVDKSELRKDKDTGDRWAVVYDKEGEVEILRQFDSGDKVSTDSEGNEILEHDDENDKMLCDRWKNGYRTAVKEKGGIRMADHIRFLLDEFKNIGNIPEYEGYLSTMRSYEISATMVYQSYDQVKAMFEKNFGEIIDNCAARIFIGGGHATAKEITEMLGNMTITSRDKSVQEKEEKTSSSFRQEQRELATAAELTSIDKDECVVFLQGEKPFNEKKFLSTEHPNWKYTGSMIPKLKFIPKDHITIDASHTGDIMDALGKDMKKKQDKKRELSQEEQEAKGIATNSGVKDMNARERRRMGLKTQEDYDTKLSAIEYEEKRPKNTEKKGQTVKEYDRGKRRTTAEEDRKIAAQRRAERSKRKRIHANRETQPIPPKTIHAEGNNEDEFVFQSK